MNYLKTYYVTVNNLVKRLYKNAGCYEKAARLLAEAVRNERLIHVIGTEMHSSIAAHDIFFREGSLLNINPMFDPSFSVMHSASRSLYLKEADCCGEFLVEYYRNIHKGDVMIVIDTDGVGRACMEVVKKSKELGLFVIAITSRQFSKAVSKDCIFRNNQKSNLCDMKEVDIIIENEVPAFDTAVEFNSLKKRAGWLSTIANSFILNAILICTIEIMEKEKMNPDMWNNFYHPEGISHNEKLIDKYFDKIKHI